MKMKIARLIGSDLLFAEKKVKKFARIHKTTEKGKNNNI